MVPQIDNQNRYEYKEEETGNNGIKSRSAQQVGERQTNRAERDAQKMLDTALVDQPSERHWERPPASGGNEHREVANTAPKGNSSQCPDYRHHHPSRPCIARLLL